MKVGSVLSRTMVSLALSAVALATVALRAPAIRLDAAGPCALQDGFDLWEGRWRLTLVAPGSTPQVVTLEMVELGSVVPDGGGSCESNRGG